MMSMQSMFESIASQFDSTPLEIERRFNQSLTESERLHMRIRYGIDDGEGLRAIEKVAHEMGITRNQAQVNEHRILRKLCARSSRDRASAFLSS